MNNWPHTSEVFENRIEWCRVWGISRDVTIRWEEKGDVLDQLAMRGWAVSESFYNDLLDRIDIAKIESMPDKLSEDEKLYLRLAYSVTGAHNPKKQGVICFPKPAKGALKGFYYDEKKERWNPRPYAKLPG